MQTDGIRKCHSELGIPDTNEDLRYVLTDKWILAQNLTRPILKPTEYMELRKKKDQGMNVPVLH